MFRISLLACLLATTTSATTTSRKTTAQLVKGSRRVVCVRCERVEARRDPRSGLVFTHVTMRLLEDLKGRTRGKTVNLRLIGGRANGVETVVPGMPTFRVGGECVLLLGKTNRSGFPVLMDPGHGALPIARDKKGRAFLAARVTGFKALKGRVSLDQFRTAVRGLEKPAKPEGSK